MTLTLMGTRVLLRPLSLSDVQGVFAYASDPVVTEFLSWETHHDLRDAEAFVKLGMSGSVGLLFAIQVEDWVAGSIGLHPVPAGHQTGELGYVLHRGFWGHGFAAEAAELLLEHAFGPLGLNRVQALCAVGHQRSVRVLEKIGMRHEGDLREYRFIKGKLLDMGLFSILRREWHLTKHEPHPHAGGTDPTDPG